MPAGPGTRVAEWENGLRDVGLWGQAMLGVLGVRTRMAWWGKDHASWTPSSAPLPLTCSQPKGMVASTPGRHCPLPLPPPSRPHPTLFRACKHGCTAVAPPPHPTPFRATHLSSLQDLGGIEVHLGLAEYPSMPLYRPRDLIKAHGSADGGDRKSVV